MVGFSDLVVSAPAGLVGAGGAADVAFGSGRAGASGGTDGGFTDGRRTRRPTSDLLELALGAHLCRPTGRCRHAVKSAQKV